MTMRSFAWFLVLAGLGYALPQDSCDTTTSQVVVPTATITYTTTPVETIHATGAMDLGTFTLVTTLSDTKTLQTITSTIGECGATGVVTVPAETSTVYTSVPAANSKRAIGLNPRSGCTVTVTSSTTYGQTYTFVAGTSTSTYTGYTAFTQATITSTKTGGKAYAIATASATTTTPCGDSTTTETGATKTITLDARCSPSAMISAYNNFGIEWISDTPGSGATFDTTADNASDCCQMCAEAEKCAASAWDIRSGVCKLEFPVAYDTGDMNCGQGLLGYYNAGPNHPMAPGTGYYIAKVCGNAYFGSAKPDDGS